MATTMIVLCVSLSAFRPLRYRLTIYSRWGKRVYGTGDWKAGWDGKAAGLPQVPGVYVWACEYQFDGGGGKDDKGTVLLIR